MMYAPHTEANRRMRLMQVAVCVALNVGLGKVANILGLPLTMDTIGTILAAALLPWYLTVLVGLLSAGAAAIVIHPAFAFYAGTQVAIAVVACALVRAGGFRNLWLAATSGLAVGIVSAIVSAPVTAIVFGGVSVPSLTAINAVLLASGTSLWRSVLTGALIVESLDKIFAGILAYHIIRRVRVLDAP
jgi:energy-coupling factor transport system substrate-specific component